MSELKPPKIARHKRFAERFVATLDGGKAYRQAGYTPRNEDEAQKKAARLLAREDVQDWIQFLIQSQQEDTVPELNEQHQMFADDWMNHGNATRAYRNAGYQPGTEGSARACASQLLARKDIQAYIRFHQKARSQRLKINADKVHEELGRIAFSDFFDAADFADGFLKVKDELPKAVRVTVASVKHKIKTNEKSEEKEIEVKLHDKMSALKVLAKFYALDVNLNELLARLRGYGFEVKDPRAAEADVEENKE